MSYPELVIPKTPTVLERICTEINTRLVNMKDEDNTQLWNNVYKGPFPSVNALSYPVVSVEQGPEQTIADLWPHHEKIVTLYCEFRFQKFQDIDNFDTFRYYLGKLQQRLFGTNNNITLGGLAINVTEIGSNPEIENQSDTNPGGLLMFNAHYRHWTGDPYHLPSETANYAYGTL